MVELLDWSNDGKKFWFGDGVVGGRSRLGLIENQKTKWFNYPGGNSEQSLEPNYGWLAQTNGPFFYDSYDREEYRKKTQQDSLFIYDIFSGKKFVVAKSSEPFRANFTTDGSLEYKLQGVSKKLSAQEIKEKLK
jgi:hypothetical protein